MPVFSIWESRFLPEHVDRGRAVTDAISQEMPSSPATSDTCSSKTPTTPGTCSLSANGGAGRPRTKC